MKRILDDELKAIELDILVSFDSICKKYNLTYYLAYGTLLGAVRHKGFIPWDDDIDVFMPRPDYDKLISIVGNMLIDGKYELQTPVTKDYIYPFAKLSDIRTRVIEKWMLTNILGVYIDIFPLDGVPAEMSTFNDTTKRLLNYHYLLCLTSRHMKMRKSIWMTIVSCLLYYPLRVLGYKRWINKIVGLASAIGFDKSEYVGNLSIDTYIKKERYLREDFGKPELIEFEGKYFYAPHDSDAILSTTYGDYMKLPPVEQRVKKHENEAYWI